MAPRPRRPRPLPTPPRSPQRGRSRQGALQPSSSAQPKAGPVLLWQRFRRDRVARLPQASDQPPWLQLLRQTYRWSTAAAVLLGIAVSVLYSRSAIVEQRWSRTYQRLQTLQRHERELQVNLAALKDRVARQAADPAAQMSLPNADNSLFVVPRDQRAFDGGGDRPNEVSRPTAQPTAQDPDPLGY